MRLSSNTPKIFQSYEQQALNTPAVEDGNALDLNQGVVYTSEVVNVTGYFQNDSYVTTITSTPTYTYAKDGSIYTVVFDIAYSIYLEPGSSNPGYYGSELLHIGDIFTISGADKDYVRGLVTSISNITFVEDWGVYTYTFTVYATVSQGNPKKIALGDTFRWNRKIFLDDSNQNDSSITGERASFNRSTNEIYLYWDETDPSAAKHRVSLRQKTNSYPSYIIDVPGPNVNSATTLESYVNRATGDISTVRIVSSGTGFAFNREVIIRGSGTGAKWATDIDNAGNLLMNNYTVYDATVGSNTVDVYSRATVPSTFSRSGGYMLPFTGTYVGGLTGLSGSQHFYVGGTTGATANNKYFAIQLYDAETGNPVSITDDWRTSVIGRSIKTHDGVFRIASGTGYTGATGSSAVLKVLPNNVSWYWDPIFGNIAGTGQIWAWSACSIYERSGVGRGGVIRIKPKGSKDLSIGPKEYSQWSVEDYFNT